MIVGQVHHQATAISSSRVIYRHDRGKTLREVPDFHESCTAASHGSGEMWGPNTSYLNPAMQINKGSSLDLWSHTRAPPVL